MDADVPISMARLLALPEHGDRLEIALLARRQLAGDPAAAEQLEVRRARALRDAASGRQRRLATLAEAYTRLPGGVPVAAEMVATALALPLGSDATAGLTLAEAVSIVAPCDTESIRLALDAAEAAARDPAQHARIATLVERWWPAPADSGQAIAELLGKPGDDPGLAPLIAARLSAAAVVEYGPPDPRLATQLRRLLPISEPDPAAHCTVLTRLLLATPALG